LVSKKAALTSITAEIFFISSVDFSPTPTLPQGEREVRTLRATSLPILWRGLGAERRHPPPRPSATPASGGEPRGEQAVKKVMRMFRAERKKVVKRFFDNLNSCFSPARLPYFLKTQGLQGNVFSFVNHNSQFVIHNY
jgi:hypothetical protein